MTYNPHNHGARNCFRCSLPLTDAASLNEGIGPICRKLDNALLARLIPANIVDTIFAYQQVALLELDPATIPTFVAIEHELRAEGAEVREDWRKVAKQVEWMLSFPQKHKNIQALKNVVLGLGYHGLVSLWNGEAATSLAHISFENNRLVVRGARNKGAAWAFKKIPGAKFTAPIEGKKGGWSVPAKESDAFVLSVIKHYPNFTGMTEAVKAAKAWLQTAPAEEVAAEDAPQVVVFGAGPKVKLKTPYSSDFVVKLKTLVPYESRKWNANEKVWEVDSQYTEGACALIQEVYKAKPQLVGVSLSA